MFIATFLTLLVLPALYVLLSRMKRTSAHNSGSAVSAALMCLVMILTSVHTSAQPLSMSDAVATAIQNSGLIKIARIDSSSADLRAMQSRSVYMPTADLQSAATRGANSVSQRTASGVVIDRSNAGFTNMNAAAVMQWTLFDGFRMYAIDDQFALMASSERERARGQFAAVIADVMTKYGAAVVAQHQIRDLRSALGLAEKRYEIVMSRKSAGSASGTQLAQATIDKNTVQSLLRRAETNYTNAVTSLTAAMGLADTSLRTSDVDTVLTSPTLPALESLLESLAKRNPEIVGAELAVEAAKARERELDAAFWPRLDLTGGYQYTNNSTEAGFILDNRTTGWNAGLTLRYNLFRGQADRAASELAQVETQRRQLLTSETMRDQRSRLQQAFERYKQGQDLISIEERSLRSAQQNAQVAMVSYQEGLITDVEVRQAQQTAIDVALRIAQLEFEVFASAVDALRISGTLVW
jgi:outer membrane protein TolC